MNWNTISQESDLSFDFLEENKESISWYHIAKDYPLTKELFERFVTKIDNRLIIYNRSFTMDVLEDIQDIPGAMDWSFFSNRYPINQEMGERFKWNIDIDALMKNEKRTIDIIEKVIPFTNGTNRIERIVKEKAEETKEELSKPNPLQTIHASADSLERMYERFATLLDKES